MKANSFEEAVANGAYTGWDAGGNPLNSVAARADFNATGGPDIGGGSSGSNGYNKVSAPDLKALQDKVYEQMKPYYLQLIKEAGGDFDRAKSILHEDYSRGVRIATEDASRGTQQVNEDLASTMKQLGLSQGAETEAKIDLLNKRGMAVGEMGPDRQYNVLNQGRGGVELGRLKEDQALRKEALQRTSERTLQDIGINLKRTTNPSTDRTQMGSTELAQARGEDIAARNRQLAGENLSNQLQQNVLSNATTLAGLGIKANEANVGNYFNKDAIDTFKNTGV